MKRRAIIVEPCGEPSWRVVHRLTQLAFAKYAGLLEPPSHVFTETEERVKRDLAENGGMLALLDDEIVGCLRFAVRDGHLHARRVAVHPASQGLGVGREMMRRAEMEAARRGYTELRLGVRHQLTDNQAFYARLGYRVVAVHDFWVEMARPVALSES